jgi:hypothetical protein
MGTAHRIIRIRITTEDDAQNFEDEVAAKLKEIKTKINEIENVEVISI